MRFHPVAEVFPLLEGEERESFEAGIRAHGFDHDHPIILHPDGSILDGRNRWRACEAAGITPSFKTYDGPKEDLVGYVARANLERRHMSVEARAFAAAALASMKRGDVAKLQAEPGRKGLGSVSSQRLDTLPPSERLISRAQAAKALGVHPAAVERARAVERHAPDLKPLVVAREISLRAAADEAAERARARNVKEENPPRKRKTEARSDLQRALDEAKAWAKRYRHLRPLAPVFQAINDVLKRRIAQ